MTPLPLPLRLPVLALLVTRVLTAAPALAAPYDGEPKILLHAAAPTTKNRCAAGSLSDCGDAVTEADLSTSAGPFTFVYLLAAPGKLTTTAGLQCGITYQGGYPGGRLDGTGIDIFSWQQCASLEFSTSGWPQPLSGNLITWDYVRACQVGDAAVAGYFYVGCYGAADDLQLIARPVDGQAGLVNCDVEVEYLPGSSLGRIRFSAGAVEPGCNPCDGPCPPCTGPGCDPSGDMTPPGAITDLSVTSIGATSVQLSWTATADNPGGSGIVDCEIRVSRDPITPDNIDDAPGAGSAAPVPEGTTQAATASLLDPATTYFAAVVVRDFAGNRSAPSNVVEFTTTNASGGPGRLEDTRLLLHVVPATGSPGPSCAVAPIQDCATEVVTAGDLVPSRHYVYVLASGYENLGGLAFGIAYDDGQPSGKTDKEALDIFSWTLCATQQYLPSPPEVWPGPGSGTLILWDVQASCQTGPVATVGYFYVSAYGPDALQLTPRPSDTQANVVDCAAREHPLPSSALGRARFSAGALEPGVNPCMTEGPIPVRPATWSKIKTLVR